MIFESQRLLVRKLSIKDLEGYHDMQGNPKVMRYVGRGSMSLAESTSDLEQVILVYSVPNNTFWVWAIESKTTADFVVTCALIVNEKGEQEIGFRLREKFWSNGFGQEVARQLIQYALHERKVKRLVAYVDKTNLASVKILEQNMAFEKEFFNEEEQCIDRKYVIDNQDHKPNTKLFK